MIKLACSTLCFRNAAIGSALEVIKSLGFDAIDLTLVPDACNHFDAARRSAGEREDFVALVRRSGLKVPTVTSPASQFSAQPHHFQAVIRSTISYLKLAALLGADALNVNCGNSIETRAFVEDEVDLLARGLKRIAQQAARLGLRINIEAPHYYGLCRTVTEAEYLLDRVGEPNVSLLLDVAHLTANREAPSDAIQRLGSRIGHVHLRDAKAGNPSLELGSGDVCFHQVFERLLEVGYTGYCALQLHFPMADLDHSRVALERAIQFFNKTLGEVGCAFRPIHPPSGAKGAIEPPRLFTA